MFARRSGEDPEDRFSPEFQSLEKAATLFHFAMLLPEHAFHLALVIRAKVERQDANESPEKSLRQRQFFHRSTSRQLGFSEELFRACLAERLLHAFSFGNGDFTPEFGQQVVAAPLVVENDFGPPGGFGDKTGALQSRQI